MEFVPPHERATVLARLRAAGDETRRAVLAAGLPVAGIVDAGRADGGPGLERFGGSEGADGRVTVVRIAYGGVGPGAPRALVQTARWDATRVESGPLRWMVEHHLRHDGERLSAVAWHQADTEMVVDGRAVSASLVRAGECWATRCETGGAELTVVARGWRPDPVRLVTIGDLAAVFDAPRPRPELLRREPEPILPELAREPYRSLVETVLAHQRRHREWLADGGLVPELPAYWSTLRADGSRDEWLAAWAAWARTAQAG
ncbi:hypothetical protein [Dactylosporangium sp. CA-233914]|uniref:hypothetical protein n=1 Tax=Dactylosporangium sp. CA-233914 TaxID=3239934 RepID=UPI003D90AE8B